MLDIKIAQVCWESIRAFSLADGDKSYTAWDNLPLSIQADCLSMVRFCLKDSNVSPKALHDEWCRRKREMGWQHGDQLRVMCKEHPCLVDFDQLSAEDQKKDELFIAIVNILKGV